MIQDKEIIALSWMADVLSVKVDISANNRGARKWKGTTTFAVNVIQ
jgi:hypothetical protein